MQRDANRSRKQALREQSKLKKAMAKGDEPQCQLLATNAIRYKKQGERFAEFASKIEGAAMRLEFAFKMKRVTQTMMRAGQHMAASLQQIDTSNIVLGMEEFEQHLETFETQANVIEEAAGNSTATWTPNDEIAQLMQQTAEEAGIEFNAEMNHIETPDTTAAQIAAPDTDPQDEQDAIIRRLEALKTAK